MTLPMPVTDRGKFWAMLTVIAVWSGIFFWLGWEAHKWLH
jgi:hypothetical protein